MFTRVAVCGGVPYAHARVAYIMRSAVYRRQSVTSADKESCPSVVSGCTAVHSIGDFPFVRSKFLLNVFLKPNYIKCVKVMCECGSYNYLFVLSS